MNGTQPSDKLQVQITQIDNGYIVGIAPRSNKITATLPTAKFCNDYVEVINLLKSVWPLDIKDR